MIRSTVARRIAKRAFIPVLLPSVLLAQGAATPLSVPRLDIPVPLVATLPAEVWARMRPLPLVQFAPNPGAPMRESGEIRIAYDDMYLYVAGRFNDAEPDQIRANSMVRDAFSEDDGLNVVLDTYHDGTTAVWFLATPNGTRIDGAISDDAEGSRWNHMEYDMRWDAVASRDAGGWSIQVRIPFRTLRFAERDGRVEMGLIAARVIGRRKERYIFPAIRPTAAKAQFKPSFAAPILLDGIHSSSGITLAPHVVSDHLTRPVRGTGAAPVGETATNVGLDVKYPLSTGSTLDLTLNTDFAQTEVDDQRVNLTRFSLFYPEKRQFFLERSGTFAFTTGGDDRVFYSRRLGLDASGQPVRILGGERVVGRSGPWDVGALEMHMAASGSAAATTAAVMRARRTIANPYSYLGAIATFSGPGLADSRRTGGIDGVLKIGQDVFLGGQMAATSGGADSTASGGGAWSRAVARIAVERRRRTGLGASAAVSYIGRGYAPALGYVARNGTTSVDETVTYGWFRPGRELQETTVGLTGQVVRGISSDRVETVLLQPSATLRWANDAQARLSVDLRHEFLASGFALSPTAAIPSGSFTFGELDLLASTAPGALLRMSVEGQAGRFFDGQHGLLAVRPSWNPSPFLELAAEAELNRARFPGRRETLNADLARLRLRVSSSTATSVTGSVQYNRVASTVSTSLRVRHSFREGTDLFLVYNDDREITDVPALSTAAAATARYYAVKYQVALP